MNFNFASSLILSVSCVLAASVEKCPHNGIEPKVVQRSITFDDDSKNKKAANKSSVAINSAFFVKEGKKEAKTKAPKKLSKKQIKKNAAKQKKAERMAKKATNKKNESTVLINPEFFFGEDDAAAKAGPKKNLAEKKLSKKEAKKAKRAARKAKKIGEKAAAENDKRASIASMFFLEKDKPEKKKASSKYHRTSAGVISLTPTKQFAKLAMNQFVDNPDIIVNPTKNLKKFGICEDGCSLNGSKSS